MTANLDILASSVKQPQPKHAPAGSHRRAEKPTATENAIGIIGTIFIISGILGMIGGVLNYALKYKDTPPTLDSSPYMMLIYVAAGLQCVIYGLLFCAAGHGLRYLRKITGGTK